MHMHMQRAFNRVDKLFQAILSTRLRHVLLRYRVLAGAEHRYVLSRKLGTVVDVGANKGQFSMAVREWAPEARVIAFEPLPGPALIYRKIFADDYQVQLHQTAIGITSEQRTINVSYRDDSSSFLPISAVQTTLFPGTQKVASIEVHVGPLKDFITAAELFPPSMLKLDVQGFEYEALNGCESLLHHFNFVYCECSFLELYSGQKMACDIIAWLLGRNFNLIGIYNLTYDTKGQSVQADFLFELSAA